MEPMSEKEIAELRQSSNWQMRQLTEKNRKEFPLDALPELAWNAWRGELVYAKGGVPGVVARIQAVGTLVTRNKVSTWTWAWAKTDLLPSVRQAVLQVRRFGEERTILSLIQPKWSASEADAWQMTAIACKLLDAKGAARCGETYFVVTELRAVSDRQRVFGASTCTHVLEEGRPILLVSREADGEVLAVCGGEDDSAATAKALPLDRLLSLDDRLAELADLPDGWVALREAEDQPWVRSKSE